MCLSGFGDVGLECGSQIPGQQILDLADRMVGDACEHRTEVELRIESVELGATDQGVHGSGTFAAAVRTGKQEDDMTASRNSDGIG